MTATDGGGKIVLTHSRYGSGNGFTVSSNPFGLAGTFAGKDVSGTIGGLAATGSGQSLTGTGTLDGLILSVTATPAEVAAASGNLALGTVTVASGTMSKMVEFLDAMTTTGGSISRARDRWTSQIKLIDDRITQMESRLADRELTLRKRFTAMETALSNMQALSNALASQLSGMTPR